MSLYAVGDAALVPVIVADPNGVAADPATLTLTVTGPDGQASIFHLADLTRAAVGSYKLTVPLPVRGTYRWAWTSTGPVDAAAGQVSCGLSLVTLDEVRAHLNYSATDHADDDELSRFALAATEVAEEIGGAMMPRTVVETYDGGGPTVVLRQRPAAVTSVVEFLAQTAYPLAVEPLGGPSYTYYGVTVDGPVLTRRSYGLLYPFMPGRRNVVVAYTAGTLNVPEKARFAVLELVRHWFQWGQQQGSGATSGAGDDAYQISSQGYLVPNRVAQALSPHLQLPGIA